MYIPKAFAVQDQQRIEAFIQQNPFGILFSQHEQIPIATHLSFIMEEKKLLSHFAKANPHWQQLDGQQVLVVLHGPHAYISPAWYEEEQTVPTWNYTAVHITGKVQIVYDVKRVKTILSASIQRFEQDEGTNWHVEIDEDYIQSLMRGIVAVEIVIDTIEGKWKLNQHHTTERQQRTIAGLQNSAQIFAPQLAELMQNHLNRKT